MAAAPDLTDIAGYEVFETVTLRYSDEDSMGHVNNVAYAAYFEAGRMGLFSEILRGMGDQKFNFVLANVAIDYLREMRFPGELRVGGRLLRVGTKSITTGYGAFLNGVCHATSTSVNVYFDPETRRSRPFPDDIRAGLTKRLERA
ncbi:MAG: thioesterase family protein [Pseudomonadota bacterium]